MRVIAGTARRLQLKTLDNLDTRPTADRIKETLFNMLAPDLYGCRFLDLFAGSGGIGIEALSRGAAEAVFVEKSPKAMRCVEENLEHTKLGRKARTIQNDVCNAISCLEGEEKFDFIYMDPPYKAGLERRTLDCLISSSLLAEDGIIIVEAAKDTDFGYVDDLSLTLLKVKEYKTNKHVFLEWARRKDIC